MGTLYIPSTVALVKGAPHSQEARLLVEYLLSADTEQQLVDSGWCHAPVHITQASTSLPTAAAAKHMDVSLDDAYQHFGRAREELKEVFLK